MIGKNGRKLIIRADANHNIGIGHVMRCLAIAQGWKDRGGSASFIGAIENNQLRQKLTTEGFEFVPITHVHPDPVDFNKIQKSIIEANYKVPEVEKKLDRVDGCGQSWVILDGYHFTYSYQKDLRKTGVNLLVIDDVAHLEQYEADIILNQNIDAERLKYNCNSDSILLFGTKYNLLRKEFIHYIDQPRTPSDKARKILITFGGTDSKNITKRVLAAINRLDDSDLRVKIFIGPSNKNLDSIERELKYAPYIYECMKNPTDIPGVLNWAEIAITSAGSTCWELAFMGVPSITVITGDNQRKVAEGLDRIDLFNTMGWWEDVTVDTLEREIHALIHDKERRRAKIQLCRKFNDGHGARRVIDIIDHCSKRSNKSLHIHWEEH